MKYEYILAIETSCDETSVAVVRNGNEILANTVYTQIATHQQFGGVVPEVASRQHVEKITEVIEQALTTAQVTMETIDAVAVTYAPGLVGALLVGVQAAKALAFAYQLPIIPVHHIAGHIYANNIDQQLQFPLIALVVSGGHTELVLMTDHYQFEVIGSTTDDAVGEAYDKVARVLKLSYPGGPQIDRLAQIGTAKYQLPTPKTDHEYDFSFSGLKSAVINLVHNYQQRGEQVEPADLAASFQKVVVETLVQKTMKAIEQYGAKQLIIAGGVSANQSLRAAMQVAVQAHPEVELAIPPFAYCTDNAAMIGAAAYYAAQTGAKADYSLNGRPSIPLS
ncbi:MAG: tRNA (adenosine(37)-N6)-threonylcarbamoyltransferase complex transferase subunit TsaD [Culicoidibacterales bacterium]